MLPTPSTIIAALSQIRDFGIFEEPTPAKALGTKPEKYLANSGSAHLEVIVSDGETIEVSLMLTEGTTPQDDLQTTELMIQLLNVAIPDMDSVTWLQENIAAEDRQPYFGNSNQATLTNPIESIVILNIQALAQATGAASDDETPKLDPAEIGHANQIEPILEPIIDEADLDLLKPIEVSVDQLQEIKLFLAEALLTEPSFNMGAIDLSESMSTMQQASKQTDPNLTVLLTSMASLMSASEVQKATNAALSEQIALKDQAIAQALTILEQILPS